MGGSRWNDLIKALNQIIVKINKLSKNGIEVHVTIINFESRARIIYNRAKPDQINAYNIPYGDGGTDFEAAFRQAYDVANSYIHQETIIFIFMTDGGASYPSKSIALFQ